MSKRKENNYSVNSRLLDHDSQLLALHKAVETIALTPGPQGRPGNTGESGPAGRNGRDGVDGRDSTVAGPEGRVGRAGLAIKGDTGSRGERGLAGKDGESIVGPPGQSIVGPPGPRGDVLIVGESELAAAVIALRKKLLEQRAAFLARIAQNIADLKKPEHQNATYRIVRMHLEGVLRDIENLK